MTPPAAPLALLLVHAHPDDEVINNGASMARYAAEGVHVTLVTCTLGEEGEVLVPELAHLAADREDRLGEHRMTEMADSMKALGVHDQRYLGGPGRYRDSGMMGTPPNERPDSFWRADVDEAAGHLAAIVREVRPQVLVTYDEIGGYGHPDHIQAHRVAMRAADLAADPAHGEGEAWEVAKVYWNAMPRSVVAAGLERMRAEGHELPFDAVEVDDLPFVVDDALVTTAVDATPWLDAKVRALRSYPTQVSTDDGFFALSNNVGQSIMSVEHYRLVRGDRGPAGADGREDDLFAGVR
ncbi:N-acetyl-1-D-myo-inositol-2-amino-2-deoxy-alpha-D-glucopyranoside deacetylase [Yinghuangia sp. ASG 101]|uniref:N-acetyl-1-D-myo-inositol-2-amino-2-deoxy-alpha- D-glucopyranoside deacetylase n=1 Tax=Yinghuangia sp. ASG 101 TaxID=2896848 RepID=UPI001E52C1A7|nr:N-acetyl-1-D-myo-inositol-2-amino-2-deoxy-alpha-D-glucopyranoside deacetylase [Yinghuangia sp. ASG 101]UGQ09462.1 N-acetyl-1-D-myo-inositol-2-amino-2-deoxy-alpha-D-glucopyranoside deacetylase [Yinghuangia sp. ASG 101]